MNLKSLSSGLIASALIFSACTHNPNTEMQDVSVHPISHATAVINWGEHSFYTDPTGGVNAFASHSAADIVLVTDIHGDHLDLETLEAVLGEAELLIPQAVYDELPSNLQAQASILNNNESWSGDGFEITAIPMYNLPESEDNPHVKGRGNGYLIEKDGFRLYLAGDTAGIPEMRALTEIDVALVPMNLPYTMDINEAAEAVLDFAPKTVYPYHYRGQDGLSDVEAFKTLVNDANPDIEVVLLDWYPAE